MRIGVVCEGPTDFHAIEGFLGEALIASGVEVEFEPIQPNLDQTLPSAGWGNVFSWLDRNPPEYRIRNYFGGGLFGGNLGRTKLDCLLIQMDSDILGELSFCTYVHENYKYPVSAPTSSADRANEIRKILKVSSRFDEMTEADISRHVLAPAVESTETWCVAAFKTPTRDFEVISQEELVNEFMSALEISENRPLKDSYNNIDKNPLRRSKFCKVHKVGWARVVDGCREFRLLFNDVLKISKI
ncbi:hypothetical protein [Pleomorphomonas sp. PLEO]|uniref:hypothetical protein n=1 Tax=Pleomorphomonas sp. PLEO TaxID=3239306 RepID=UPI00351E5AD9